MKIITALSLSLLSAVLFAACTPDVQAMNGQQIEQKYGVSGAYNDTIVTPDGQMRGTLVIESDTKARIAREPRSAFRSGLCTPL